MVVAPFLPVTELLPVTAPAVDPEAWLMRVDAEVETYAVPLMVVVGLAGDLVLVAEEPVTAPAVEPDGDDTGDEDAEEADVGTTTGVVVVSVVRAVSTDAEELYAGGGEDGLEAGAVSDGAVADGELVVTVSP